MPPAYPSKRDGSGHNAASFDIPFLGYNPARLSTRMQYATAEMICDAPTLVRIAYHQVSSPDEDFHRRMNWVRILTNSWIQTHHTDERNAGFDWLDPRGEGHFSPTRLPLLDSPAECDKAFIPFPVHLWGYNYCGPGTRDFFRKPVDEIDAICQTHDKMYADPSVSTEIADKTIHHLYKINGMTGFFLKSIFQTKIWFDSQFPGLSDYMFRPNMGSYQHFKTHGNLEVENEKDGPYKKSSRKSLV